MKARLQILWSVLITVNSVRLASDSIQAQSVLGIVVPNSRASIDGTSGDTAPFVNGATSVRWQQVYDASQFLLITPHGGWVGDIVFRLDGECRNGFGTDVSSLQINLSTTSKTPDGLSSIFAENIGADDRIVFGPGSLHLVQGCIRGTSPQPFAMLIPFTTPFYYNPTNGNLLMDIRNYSGGTDPGMNPGLIDGELTTGDSVSRVDATDVNASSGIVFSFGLVTLFYFWPNAELSVRLQTNSVVLTWPANPDFLLLETSQNVAPQAQWQTITTGIVQNGPAKTLTIPIESAGKEAYFRLVSPP